MAVPMLAGGHVVGAITVYADQPYGLTVADRVRAQDFAEYPAGPVVALAAWLRPAGTGSQRAIQNRAPRMSIDSVRSGRR
jgi:hypothetical protein